MDMRSEGEGGFWMPDETWGTVAKNQDSRREEGLGDHEFEDLLREGFHWDISGLTLNGRCINGPG